MWIQVPDELVERTEEVLSPKGIIDIEDDWTRVRLVLNRYRTLLHEAGRVKTVLRIDHPTDGTYKVIDPPHSE